MRRELSGRVVVVTGATGGLGRALAHAAARAGAQLGLLDLEASALDALARELEASGALCVTAVCDVTDAAACARAVNTVVERFGGVDVLINNAGLTQRSAFIDTELSVVRRVMEVNFFGALSCTKAALPHLLKRRGQITVVSSVAGFAPLLGRSGYCASKHALHGLFGTMRAELAGQGISVLMVSPSFIRTAINKNALDGDGSRTAHPQSTVGSVMSPEHAAQKIVQAIEKDRRTLLLGRVAHLTRLLVSLWPRLYERIMVRSLAAELRR
jgi:NAD(P)-dependent dehydrogenase (short-subunit alcohol dehydrogenase family)